MTKTILKLLIVLYIIQRNWEILHAGIYVTKKLQILNHELTRYIW